MERRKKSQTWTQHSHFNRTHIFNQNMGGRGGGGGDGQGAKREKAFYNIILQNGEFSKGDLENKEEKNSLFLRERC